MKLIIASNNAHKVREIKEILGAHFDEILSMHEAQIALDVVEDGATFEQNAIKKAVETLAAALGADAALSDDSGIEVDALHGEPGVYSARFAGEGHDDRANNLKLIAAMKDVPDCERTCRFVSAVALALAGRPPVVFRGTVEGKLLRAPRGENGFGYDPLFLYEPLGLTFAEMDGVAKNAISHRRRALEALKAALERGE